MYSIFLFTTDMETSIEVSKVNSLEQAVSLASSLYLMSKKPVRVHDENSHTDVASFFNV